jgi:SAM-dependent methyltransferase
MTGAAIPLEACPACGAREPLSFELGGAHTLRRCSRCGTVHAPEYAPPEQVFTDGYLQGGGGQFGIDVRHPIFQEYLARVAHRRMRLIERYTGLKKARLLDVGCGTGEVLAAARGRGWRVVGVEPEASSAAVARDRGLEIHTAMLADAGLPQASYDVVSAFHVLEHLPDSRAFLREISRWARPGGFVVVEVPNFASVQRRRRGRDWIHLRPMEHLVHFTPDTLRAVLESSGLRPVSIRSPEYLGPPQALDEALMSAGREGRFRRLVAPLCRSGERHGRPALFPTRAGWLVLRAMEAAHDRAGAGSVVFAVSGVPGPGAGSPAASGSDAQAGRASGTRPRR